MHNITLSEKILKKLDRQLIAENRLCEGIPGLKPWTQESFIERLLQEYFDDIKSYEEESP